jgi:uracil-DNA glycosylase family 4
MSIETKSPDRSVVLASLRDYIEQLREEGLEGLPASDNFGRLEKASVTPLTGIGQKARTDDSTDIRQLIVKPDSSVGEAEPLQGRPTTGGGDLFYSYAGLEKAADLDSLREFIGDCTRCKLAPGRTKLVFGVGNPNADLMFVGEAPGADEDLQGEPFVGRAGQLLTDIIERGMRIRRQDVYICNVIKCRPPENRNPEPDEVSTCEPFLFRQIDLVKPQAIVGLGTFAVQALLKVKTPISKLRGHWQEVRGIKMMPTFHPAYLLRNPADKRLVWADIQEVMKLLGQTIPPRGSQR